MGKKYIEEGYRENIICYLANSIAGLANAIRHLANLIGYLKMPLTSKQNAIIG